MDKHYVGRGLDLAHAERPKWRTRARCSPLVAHGGRLSGLRDKVITAEAKGALPNLQAAATGGTFVSMYRHVAWFQGWRVNPETSVVWLDSASSANQFGSCIVEDSSSVLLAVF